MLRTVILLAFLASSAVANPVPGPLTPGGSQGNAPVSEQAVTASPRPVARKASFAVPVARWSNEGVQRSWTVAILKALRSHARPLTDFVPRDIATWCPSYPTGAQQQREAFWVGLVSSLAWHESTHRPTAVGGGNQWYGLTQIYPPTAKLYECRARSGSELKDAEDNLSCALRIMAHTVPRDGVISAGMRGVAADWGPFHSSRKLADMREWVRSQDYCTGLSTSLRPVVRPASLAPDALRPVKRPGQPQPPTIEVRDMVPADQPVYEAQDIPSATFPPLKLHAKS